MDDEYQPMLNTFPAMFKDAGLSVELEGVQVYRRDTDTPAWQCIFRLDFPSAFLCKVEDEVVINSYFLPRFDMLSFAE